MSQDPTFVLYRILGNDLPPRHGAGQTLDNLRRLLAEEPPLAGCEKRWVVNRIADPDIERTILDALAQAGAPVLHIPFSLDAYIRLPPGIAGVEPERHFHRRRFHTLSERTRDMTVERYLEPRALYAFNINAARNAALQDGRGRATWVLPWDGSIFVPETAWAAVRAAALDAGPWRYLIVPTARMAPGEHDPSAIGPDPLGEPMIAFRHDAAERFDERLPYGKVDKVALLIRLGVDGIWDQWPLARAGAGLWSTSAEAGSWHRVGWVVRLPPGSAAAEASDEARHRYRRRAIIAFLRGLDERSIAKRMSESHLSFLGSDIIAHLVRRPGAAAQVAARVRALAVRVPSPILQTSGGSARPRPDGAGSDGGHDGNPDPDADAIASQLRATRERLRRTLQHIVTATLAMETSRERSYGNAAASSLRALCVDPPTAMCPGLLATPLAQDHRAHNIGLDLRALAPLPFALEAARRLGATGALSGSDMAAVLHWSQRQLDWFASSPRAAKACAHQGDIGTLHDLVVLGLAIGTSNAATAREVVERAPMRIAEQVDRNGAQPSAAGRERPFGNAIFNLEAWACLGRAMQPLGFDPWAFALADGRSLVRAVAHLLRCAQQGEGDDGERQRLAVLAGLCRPALTATDRAPVLLQPQADRVFRPDLMWWARAITG